MENTSNYGLKRWDPEDRILHTEFNDNWDKIDTALKSSADGVAALQTALASCGNCKIVYGTYTGNGKYGKDNPNQLTFDGNPLFVIIKGSIGFCSDIGDPGHARMVYRIYRLRRFIYRLPPYMGRTFSFLVQQSEQ